MEGKQIHIVFQVINHLSQIPHVTAFDKLLLITLASFSGVRGICPSASKIAQRMGVSIRQVHRGLGHLSDKNIIKINRNLGKESTFQILKLSTTPDNVVSTQKLHTPDNVVSTPLTKQDMTPDKTGQHINNKVITNEITERGSLVFEPDQKRIDICRGRGWDERFMTQKFLAYKNSTGKKYTDEQAAFELFVLNEKPIGKSNGNVVQMPIQQPKPPAPVEEYPFQSSNIHSTCGKEYTECRCFLFTDEVRQAAMDDIRIKLGKKPKYNLEGKECHSTESTDISAR